MMRHHDHMTNNACSTELQRFCAMFGTSPDTCSLLWDLLDPTTTMPNEVKAVHLLWGLMFLKLFASEAVHCAISGGVDEKLFENCGSHNLYSVLCIMMLCTNADSKCASCSAKLISTDSVNGSKRGSLRYSHSARYAHQTYRKNRQ